jgi:hypothetical protein
MTSRLVTRWFVAAGLLLFGLWVGGVAMPHCSQDHLPARAEARAVSVQQSLRQSLKRGEVKVEQASAAPMLALLLFAAAIVVGTRRAAFAPVRAVAVVLESSLWLTPYLFRPPPSFLVR